MRHIGLIEPQPHGAPSAFICPHCGKECKSEAALKAHCKKEHPEVFDKDE